MIRDRISGYVGLIATARRWPPIDRRRLRSAGSIAELRELAPQGDLRPFNGQILRTKYLEFLFRTLGCTGFLETGTYYGVTALAARDLFATEVHTVETARRIWAARALRALTRTTGVHMVAGDSAEVLGEWLDARRGGPRPLIYLDAHWGAQSPLLDEVRACAGHECVVVIDDCQVPADPGFGFDPLPDGRPISPELLRGLVPTSSTMLLPAHSAADESGHRKGTLVVLVGVDLPRAIEVGDRFADSLFARWSGS